MDFLKFLSQVKTNEGLRLKPYKDAKGFWTIGYGCNLETSFTKEMAQCILELKAHAIYVEILRRFSWFPDLDDVRQRAIMDMAFNMGVDGVAGFKKMIAAIKAKNFTTAGKEVLNSDYANDVGDRAHRVARMISLGVDNGDA